MVRDASCVLFLTPDMADGRSIGRQQRSGDWCVMQGVVCYNLKLLHFYEVGAFPFMVMKKRTLTIDAGLPVVPATRSGSMGKVVWKYNTASTIHFIQAGGWR